MKYVEELKQKKILTKEDIEKIRARITEIQPEHSQKQKADALAGAIKRRYYSSLEQFPEEKKAPIFKTLIENTAQRDFDSTSNYDVFQEYVKKSNMDDSDVFILKNWVNQRVQEKVEVEDLYQNPIVLEKLLSVERQNRSRQRKSWWKENLSNLEVSWHRLLSYKISSRGIKRYLVEICLLLLVIFEILRLWLPIFHEVPIEEPLQYTPQLSIEAMIQVNFQEELFTVSERRELEFYEYDEIAFKKYLENKNSLLVNSQYYDTIIYACRFANIDPLLLFAIIGQEQGFVPKDDENASLIINNPYNVFGSWQKYNTNLPDSTLIAIRTIQTSLKERQEGEPVFVAINRRYAEDELWNLGVSYFYYYFDRTFR